MSHCLGCADCSSLTQTFSSADSSPVDSTLQQRLQALTGLHKEATASLVEKDAEIRSLQNRLSELSSSSRSAIGELTKRTNELEREFRWAKEGRVIAERNEALAKKEVEALRQVEDVSDGSTALTLGPEHAWSERH